MKSKKPHLKVAKKGILNDGTEVRILDSIPDKFVLVEEIESGKKYWTLKSNLIKIGLAD